MPEQTATTGQGAELAAADRTRYVFVTGGVV